MANNFNDVVNQAAVIATSFDSMSFAALRPRYIFDALAQEKRWDLNRNPNKGDTMTFTVRTAIGANTATLSPTSTAINGGKTLSYTRRSVSLIPYGDYASTDVFEMQPETFVDFMSDVAMDIGDQGFNSLNKVARNAFDLNRYADETSGILSTTYHFYASGLSNTPGNMGPLKAADVRCIVQKLKAANVEPYENGFYRSVIDPITATQLRAETGNAAWRAAALAGDERAGQIFTGSIGIFEGVEFIVNNEVSGAGTGTLTSYFMGREAVGKAIGRDIRVSMKPELEGPHSSIAIMRWNALVGYKIIRRDALYIVEGNNTKL